MPAVIFDLDGVLVDSEPFWGRAYSRFVSERYGAQLTAEEARRFEGGRVFETVENLMATFGHASKAQAEAEAHQVADSLIEEVSSGFRTQGDHIASSVRTLAAVHDQGVAVGVASSSQVGFIETVLEAAGVRDLVDVVVSAYELPRGKPYPDVYEIASQRLRIPPEEGVAVEDSANGVRSALDAGLACVCLWRNDEPAPSWIATSCTVVDELTPGVVLSALRPRRSPQAPVAGEARP